MKPVVPKPPAFAQWLLRIVVPAGVFGQAIIGDLHEEFVARAHVGSVVRARMWYRYQAFRLIGRFGAKKLLPNVRPAATRHLADPSGRAPTDRFTNIVRDVRHAVRSLMKRPSFATTVVATLALGIGATTAVFSVVNGVLLQPLPFPDSDRIVNIWGRFLPVSGFDFPTFPLSEPEYIDYRDGNRSMETVALYSYVGANITDGDGDPERIQSVAVTSNLFSVLRVTPLVGRTLTPQDDTPRAMNVAVISESLWHRRFAGDPSVLGRSITINGTPTVVVGVLPQRFTFPIPTVELWTAYQLDEANPGGRQSHNSFGVGRLAPGVLLEQAEVELATLMTQWERDFPDIHTGHFLFLRPMIDDVVGDVRAALLLVFGAVGFVLLIVCANVANLLMARAEHRRREMALRGALGAGRARLIQQLFAESLVLSVVGGALGLMLALIGTRLFLAVGAENIPRAGEVSPDVNVLLFTGIVTIATCLIFGLLPAWQTASLGLRDAMHEGGRGATAASSRLRFRRALVVAEMALSVLLVIGAGLSIRSFWRLAQEDPGFQPENLLVAQLSLPRASYTPEQSTAFYTRLIGELSVLPGVQNASGITNLPIMHSRGLNDFDIEGRPRPGPGEPALNAAFASPLPGYFASMQIPLLRGRTFDESDHVDAMPVAMINETLARQFFPNEDPIGKRIRFGALDSTDGWRQIVGIVADVKYEGLGLDVRPIYYFPNLQALQDFSYATGFMAIVVRTQDDPLLVAPAVRSVIARLDNTLPIVGLQPMTDLVHRSMTQPRFVMLLLAGFGGVAMVLGAIGIYGIITYGVAQRSVEIGIRIALGARTRQVLSMVVAQGMLMAAFGVGIGVVGALAVTRLMESQLFEISTRDPVTFLSVSIILMFVALVASYLPARRAALLDPIKTLRSD